MTYRSARPMQRAYAYPSRVVGLDASRSAPARESDAWAGSVEETGTTCVLDSSKYVSIKKIKSKQPYKPQRPAIGLEMSESDREIPKVA
jgi:hypothetical protein